MALDILGDWALSSSSVHVLKHPVPLPVELEDVFAHSRGCHSAHLGHLGVGQDIPVKVVHGSIPVPDQAPYLIGTKMVAHYPRDRTSHLGGDEKNIIHEDDEILAQEEDWPLVGIMAAGLTAG